PVHRRGPEGPVARVQGRRIHGDRDQPGRLLLRDLRGDDGGKTLPLHGRLVDGGPEELAGQLRPLRQAVPGRARAEGPLPPVRHLGTGRRRGQRHRPEIGRHVRAEGAELRRAGGERLQVAQRGLTQVSDQARQALELCRSPRISAQGVPAANRPPSSIWAARAGKNVLKTPRGRSLNPGGAFRTKGSSVSYQVRTSSPSAVTTVSVGAGRGTPARSEPGDGTRSRASPNAGKSRASIVS